MYSSDVPVENLYPKLTVVVPATLMVALVAWIAPYQDTLVKLASSEVANSVGMRIPLGNVAKNFEQGLMVGCYFASED